jgi:signal transduction histidine kinase
MNAILSLFISLILGLLALLIAGLLFFAVRLNQLKRGREAYRVELQSLEATLDARVTARTRELAALYEVSAVASQALDLDTLLRESLQCTLKTLGSSVGGIFLLERDAHQRETLVLGAAQGILPEQRSDLAQHLMKASPLEQGAFQWVFEAGEPRLIQDAASDPTLPAVFRGQVHQSLLLAPLRASNQVLGLLSLMRSAEISFTVEEIALVASLADQVGKAVESDRMRVRVQQSLLLSERQRLSRDMHDSVTQSLYGLVTLAEAGQGQLEVGSPEAAARTFMRMGQITRQALREMRLFLYELHPSIVKDEGLVAALHLRLAAVEGRADVQARLLADETIHLPQPVEEAFYQITQEALNNALKHAHSQSVTVYLGRETRDVVLEVIDDGCGFDLAQVQPGGFGLNGMTERASAIGAQLKVLSFPNQGTRIRVVFPEAQ